MSNGVLCLISLPKQPWTGAAVGQKPLRAVISQMVAANDSVPTVTPAGKLSGRRHRLWPGRAGSGADRSYFWYRVGRMQAQRPNFELIHHCCRIHLGPAFCRNAG
jgi:hypothetical protein